MTSHLVLSLPDFSKFFELHCDTSTKCVGVVLMQEKHLVYYEIRKLSWLERSFKIYDKEMLAIMHSLAEFWQYLLGGKFSVETNHNSLKYFLGR